MTTRAGTSTRAVVAALLAALSLTAAVAPAAARAGGAPAPAEPSAWRIAHRASAPAAPAGARLAACKRGPALDGRTAVVAAWMRPLPGGRRLALRIDLWQRTPGSRWTLRDDVPGLSTWTSPSDALVGSRAGDVFKYRQAVGRLVVPAAYRFRVSFRWLDAAGTIVREAAVTTRACREPDLRPDLVLDAVSARALPHAPGLVRYELLVRNAGRGPVARAVIAATFPGERTPGGHVRRTGPIAPGASVVVAFSGPGCGADAPPATFLADPANALEEIDEANNALTASCPAP